MDVKPIPLTPRAAGPDRSAEAARTQAMEKAEREFHAMLLREMLRPLTQALFGNENGFSGAGGPLSSGNETYAYFLEQALSQQLAEGWQLPSPFGSPPSPARPDPFAGARPNPSAVAAPGSRGVADGPGRPAPLSLRGAPIPLASAATPGEPIPISADPPARTSRLPGSLASSATRYSRSGSAAHVPVEPSATAAQYR